MLGKWQLPSGLYVFRRPNTLTSGVILLCLAKENGLFHYLWPLWLRSEDVASVCCGWEGDGRGLGTHRFFGKMESEKKQMGQ